jgi:hypothetical protein
MRLLNREIAPTIIIEVYYSHAEKSRSLCIRSCARDMLRDTATSRAPIEAYREGMKEKEKYIRKSERTRRRKDEPT